MFARHRHFAEERQGQCLVNPRLSRWRITGSALLATLMLGSVLSGAGPVVAVVQVSSSPLIAEAPTGMNQTRTSLGSKNLAPVKLRIPSIGVRSSMMPLGLQRNGSLQVPPNSSTSGWYAGGPRPGQVGPSVIAAHVHWDGKWAVFQHLSSLKYGDVISVDRSDGSTVKFRVTRVARFKKAQFPTKLVYGNISYAGLRLITCDSFDAKRRAYMDNVVVFAVILSSRPLGL